MLHIRHRLPAARSWQIVGVAMLVAFFGMGVPWYAVGVFLSPMVEEFGWGRGAYSLATSIHLVLMTLGGAPSGRLVDRFGPRRVILAGTLLAGLIWALIAQVGRLGPESAMRQLYLLYALLGLSSAAMGIVPVSSLIARRFTRRRGLAMGLSIVGSGLPGVVLVPLSAPFMAAYGWRALALLLGALTWALCLPALLSLPRYRPPAGDRRPGGRAGHAAVAAATRAAFASPALWILGGALLLMQFGSTAMQMHAIPFLMDQGLSRAVASQIWGLLALAGIAGKIGLGSAADRFSPRRMLLLSFSLQVAALGVALAWRGLAAGAVFAVLAGLGVGGQMAIRPPMVERYFGLVAFGTVSGAVSLFMLPGVAAGQTLAGYLYDLTGSYSQAYTLFAAMLLLAMAVLLLLREPPLREPGGPWRPPRGS